MSVVSLIAHRGFAGQHPENTLPAIERAATVADGVEVDVRRCATGDPVVIHDATVDRVTGASGRVADYSRDELAALSVLGTDAGVPALEDVFAVCPPGVTLHVEVKDVGVASDVLALSRERPHDVVLSAFDPDALRACRDGEAPLAFLHADPGGVERAAALDCDYVHPRRDLVDAGYVERAREAELAVNAWTVAGRAEAGRLVEAGVDGIIADSADVLAE